LGNICSNCARDTTSAKLPPEGDGAGEGAGVGVGAGGGVGAGEGDGDGDGAGGGAAGPDDAPQVPRSCQSAGTADGVQLERLMCD
jgi:hypothetical protein